MESKIFLYDKLIGKRIRMYRKIRGLSQASLAKLMKVSPQQLQKYEKGINRISASRLQYVAEILQIPASLLFEDDIKKPSAFHENADAEKEITQLLYYYSMIKSKKIKQMILNNSAIYVACNL